MGQACLRVYEPLAAFPPARRAALDDLVRRGAGVRRADALDVERAAGRRALLGDRPAYLPAGADRAIVVDVDGLTLVCPLDLRERSLEALLDACDGLPRDLADAFVPLAVRDAAERELEGWRDREPESAVHVLTQTWHVPLAWFVLVEPEERWVALGGEGTGGLRVGRELVYRTAMSRARRRVAKALAVLRRSGVDGDAPRRLTELGQWLEAFHPRAMVELDYGDLVHLLDDAELQTDESARDVAEALVALGRGDMGRAARCYERVQARMKALQAVETRS